MANVETGMLYLNNTKNINKLLQNENYPCQDYYHEHLISD